ncbi:hypothetical protein [Chryseobacterium bernardetii]|uniref:hypothetical protein n=1 Tax=Chryseobacterium bernardetii TaxID=1241978 RepID=UPI000F4EF6CF|nr:hypothetical protein [Chryseobacterium bernardetii]AZB34255.1 hypothetical protein EG351_11910 [Chryseobacterium bernardetii]
MEYIRKIIDVESRLGFMFVPAKAQEYLPAKNSKIKVHTSGVKKNSQTLMYSSEYNRIYGLTAWYKQNNVIRDTLLEISIKNSEVYISIPQLAVSESKMPKVSEKKND